LNDRSSAPTIRLAKWRSDQRGPNYRDRNHRDAPFTLSTITWRLTWAR